MSFLDLHRSFAFPRDDAVAEAYPGNDTGARREDRRDPLLKGTLVGCQDWGMCVVRVGVGAWWQGGATLVWEGLGCGQLRVATGERLLARQAKAPSFTWIGCAFACL